MRTALLALLSAGTLAASVITYRDESQWTAAAGAIQLEDFANDQLTLPGLSISSMEPQTRIWWTIQNGYLNTGACESGMYPRMMVLNFDQPLYGFGANFYYVFAG
jgi:hypothetical protein